MTNAQKEQLAKLLPIEYESTSEGIRPRIVKRASPAGGSELCAMLAATPSSEVFNPLVEFIDSLLGETMYPSLEPLIWKAVELYKEDTLAASIVTSWIESKSEWYVSVVRWRGPRKEMTRQVLFGVTNANLEAAYAEALRRLS